MKVSRRFACYGASSTYFYIKKKKKKKKTGARGLSFSWSRGGGRLLCFASDLGQVNFARREREEEKKNSLYV